VSEQMSEGARVKNIFTMYNFADGLKSNATIADSTDISLIFTFTVVKAVRSVVTGHKKPMLKAACTLELPDNYMLSKANMVIRMFRGQMYKKG
jgi:hypothetical protein